MNKAKQKIYLRSLDGIDFKFCANWFRDGFCYITRSVKNIWTEDEYDYGVITVDGVNLVVTDDGDEWSIDCLQTRKLHREDQ